MFKIIKLLILLFLIIASFTIPLGSKTFAGHIRAIWQSDETKDMRAGVNKKYEEIKRNNKLEIKEKLKKKLKEELKDELKDEIKEELRKETEKNSSS